MGRRQSSGLRKGTLFITESLDLASYLEEMGLKPAEGGSPKPTTNRYGSTRFEWHFEDPDGRGENLMGDFYDSLTYRTLVRRSKNLSIIKTYRT